MTAVMRARDVNGLPVVAIDSGEDIAEIRDVVFDAEHHRLAGFTLNKRGLLSGRMKDTLGAEMVFAIGPDAVMIESESLIHEKAENAAPAKPVNVIGNRVLTADGTCLGKVAGVLLRVGASPEAVGYEIESESDGPNVFVPTSDRIALSDDNLLLPADFTTSIHEDLAAFTGSVTQPSKDTPR